LDLAQEPLQRAADGAPLYPGSIAGALESFGEEADALRVLLAEHEAVAAE
jgi:hypothetical protein